MFPDKSSNLLLSVLFGFFLAIGAPGTAIAHAIVTDTSERSLVPN